MTDYSYSIMNSSTRVGESGARPHREFTNDIPVDSTKTKFVLSIQLIEFSL